METKGRIRQVILKDQDILNALLTDKPIHVFESISEREIARFCHNCDSLEENGICRLGSNDQGRYAIRKQCGWASVGQVRGDMTENGFIPSKQSHNTTYIQS